MNDNEKVTEEMIDEAASRLADRLDMMLSSLPSNHPEHYATPKEGIPNRRKEPIHAKDREKK